MVAALHNASGAVCGAVKSEPVSLLRFILLSLDRAAYFHNSRCFL